MKNRNNRKKLIYPCMALLLSTVLFLLAMLEMDVSAEGTGRKSEIQSKGIIDFADGTVVMDSADLIYLADEMDRLEESYKTNTAAALNGVGTYFKADGGTVYQKEEETLPAENAANLSFQNLYDGILHSQSVAHLAAIQATNLSGAPLYYQDADSQNNQNLISATTQANDFPIYIRPATADNLTAGCAAWVNGTLLIGNGKDNNSYYEKGGSDTVKNMYGNVSVTETYDDISSAVYITSLSDLWTEKNDKKEETYHIPLINGEGKMLYAVSFTYKHRTHSKPVNQQDSNVSGQYRLETEEGELIASEDISASKLTTDAYGWTKVNVYIDLFENTFSTESDTLSLYIKTRSHGRYTFSGGENETVVDARLIFEQITAKYK
ncbi:MAG: hypothetical protein NC318_06665 [Blautia sp.]|nr:hypothetical protein [Lachnoclostridium sp.]MCM1211268.1 hypothetical protein [Blautia sp.]